MANVDAAFGLKPIRHLNGSPWNGQTTTCHIPLATGTNFFVGDAVQLAGSSDATGKYATVAHATITTTGFIFGVITGFSNVIAGTVKSDFPDDLTKVYGPASTDRFPEVCIDPDVIYIIQDDGEAALTIDSVGLNANGIGTMSSAGSTVTGLSGLELDSNGNPPATTAGDVFHILALHNCPGNELGVNAVWEVLINLHTLKATGDSSGILGV